jgi:hypothetical protein
MFEVSKEVVGNGEIILKPSKESYMLNDEIGVEAVPDEGWYFEKWGGDLEGNINPAYLKIDSNKSIKAYFIRKKFSIDLSYQGNGEISKSPDKSSYYYGVEVTLTAKPDEGWSFDGWYEDDVKISEESTFEIEILEERNVYALFTINEYTLTVNSENGVVEKDPDSSDTYEYGSVVELHAISDEGYHFIDWTGDIEGEENPDTVLIDSDKEITANFEINKYTFSLDATGNGEISKAPDLSEYDHGTEVTITATPDEGWSFDGWYYEDETRFSLDQSEKILLTESKKLRALFTINNYFLNIDILGEGTVTKIPDKEMYEFGDVVTLTALGVEGWEFSNWIGDVTDLENNVTTITMSETKEATAVFERKSFDLNLSKDGNGEISKSPDKSSYYYGVEVTLTETPDEGWSFTGWYEDGNLISPESIAEITIYEERDIEALFTINEYTLTVNSEYGNVTKNPYKSKYEYGSTVQVSVEPEYGYEFDHWEGDASSTDNPVEIIMDSEKVITAIFNQLPLDKFTLTVDVQGNGSVDKTPDKSEYFDGETVRIEAAPENEWYFSEWEGDETGSENPLLIDINSNKVITAIFLKIPNVPPTISKVSGPTGNVDESSQTFKWSASDSDGMVTGYEYRKDSDSWEELTNTQYTWLSITKGEHTFEVRAKDDDLDYSNIISWGFEYINLESGMFKVANSWGVGGWENVDDGFLYITYEAMIQNNVRTYILTPDFTMEPRCIAVFELEHPDRGDTEVYIGVGDPDHPSKEKEFSPYLLNGGDYSYPDNKMVLDITELLPIDNDIYLKVYDGGGNYTGTIEYFAIEYYDNYSLSNPDKIYIAEGLPVNTSNYDDTIVLIENVQLNDTLYSSDEYYSSRYVTEKIGDEDLEEIDDSDELINGYGTGLRPFMDEDIEWLKNNARKIVGIKDESSDSLPSNVDNSVTQYFPPIGNQANVGSCVAWSVGYYTNTYYNAMKYGWDLSGASWVGGYYGSPASSYQDKILSPNFIYNQINNGKDGGSSYVDAIELVWNTGESSWGKFPYVTKPGDGSMNYCTDWPGEQAWREAPLYRNKKGNLYYLKVYDYDDINILRDLVNQGYLISISINAGEYSNLTSEDVWNSSNYNVSTTNHANTIVGYID